MWFSKTLSKRGVIMRSWVDSSNEVIELVYKIHVMVLLVDVSQVLQKRLLLLRELNVVYEEEKEKLAHVLESGLGHNIQFQVTLRGKR